MNHIREITAFLSGDINNINTWSGVPFFFSAALKKHGIKINSVDISINRKIEWIYNKMTGTIFIKIFHNTRADYSTSLFRYMDVKKKIKRGIRNYPNSDCLVFFTFCYSAAELTTIPSIMISDWTVEYFMRNNLKRKPGIFERGFIRRDDREIERTHIVFSLFPVITEYFRSRYQNKNIFYLGNGVNAIPPPPPYCTQNMIMAKQQSFKILFIGGKKYFKGLETLLGAFQMLKHEFPNLSIHVIGISENEYTNKDKKIHFYGYLDKDKASDAAVYYNLMQEAAMYINTTPSWPSFQAPVEALYFYTPVIISPNDEYTRTFGSAVEKCCFFCGNYPDLIAQNIRNILCAKDYFGICASAHELVKNFTWDAVAKNFLAIVQNYLSEKSQDLFGN